MLGSWTKLNFEYSTRGLLAKGAAEDMKKLHLLDAKDTHVMFRDPEFLSSAGLEITDDPQKADVFGGIRLRDFKPEIVKLNRLNVLWTHEPFFDDSIQTRVKSEGGDAYIYVFNLYNRNVYLDNFYAFPDRGKEAIAMIRSEEDLNCPFDRKSIVTLMTAKRHATLMHGKDVSLATWRVNFALEMYAKGNFDVFGREWPDGVALGESRYKDRRNAKAEILKGYNFNFCPENTSWDYYVTEKFWEAITGNCMPIYVCNATLPMSLPAELFVNCATTTTSEEVSDVVQSMKFSEFAARMNAMKEIVLRFRKMQFGRHSRDRRREVFLSFIRSYI